jgi:hypothetical protein
VMACFLFLTTVTLCAEWQSVARTQEAYHYLRKPMVTALLVIFLVLLAAGKSNTFIYFAF